jgi:hypothetical protein
MVIEPSHWIRIAAVCAVALLAATGATRDAQASTLTASVSPMQPGDPAAPSPARVTLRATSTGPQGELPPQLRTLRFVMPDGFSTYLAGVLACDPNLLAKNGSKACPPTSKLGGGSAAFDTGGFGSGTTHELSIFSTGGTAIAAYARITTPVTKSIVLPGTLQGQAAPAGPLLTLDLGPITRVRPATVFVTRAAFTLGQGLMAGPCPSGTWTFRMHLEFVNGTVDDTPQASAPCTAPPPTVPSSTPPAAPPPFGLQVSVRSRRHAAGARFAISLSEPATVTIVLRRRAGGRWILVRRRSVPRPAGRSSMTLHRPHRHGLPAGRYRALVSAVGASGATASKARRFSLR